MLGVHIPQGVPLVPHEIGPHNMTSNTAPSPFVASASSAFPSLDPWKAFDGDFTSTSGVYWIGQGGGVDWLQLDIGAGKTEILTSYEVMVNRIPEPARAPKNFTMQGSNNATVWDTLHTAVNQTGWTSGQKRKYVCDVKTTAYRYFRINITANNGDATYTQIEEMYFWAGEP